jgi:alpha-mannosidase
VLPANPDLSPRPIRATVHGTPFTAPGTVAGLEVLRVPAGEPAGALAAGPDFLENDLIRVEVAPDGTLARVYDKRAGREVLDGRGNQVWAYVDKPREWDAWELDAAYAEEGLELTARAIRMVEDGPHRAALRIERVFRDSRIVQDIRLWAGSPRIDFRTRFDWHDRRWLVKARFPLAVRSPRATFETAFGVVERPTHRNTSWDEARFEVPGHRFADLSEPGYGVALLNDGRYGHHALGSELGLSLLRSPVWPDPLADEGEQELVYSLLPHAGGWLEGGVLAEAEDLNRPLYALPAHGAPASLRPLRIEGLPIALGALKALEDGGGLLLRVYEPQGARGAIAIDASGWSFSPVDLLERDAPEEPFGPFAVRSFRATRAHRGQTP